VSKDEERAMWQRLAEVEEKVEAITRGLSRILETLNIADPTDDSNQPESK
jgi:hypothetical protein